MIGDEILRRLPLPIPPMALQEVFARQCREVFSIQTQQNTATKQVEAIFDGRLACTFEERCHEQ